MPASGLDIRRIELASFVALDLAPFVADEQGAAVLMHERGRPEWLAGVHARLRKDWKGSLLLPGERDRSAYAATDRHGRRTFAADVAESFLPLAFPVRRADRHFAGVLEWRFERVRLGPFGAISVSSTAALRPDVASVDVRSLVESYYRLRQEMKAAEDELFADFRDHWNAAIEECQLAAIGTGSDQGHSFCYDVIDFDYLVDGVEIPPKVLYRGENIEALRDLAGLTRMSVDMHQYDPDGVRRLGQFDLGGRSDELWIVNEARLVRHHPELASNAYVEAFFRDVGLGVELLAHQAATLGFLGSWLRTSRSEYLDRLLEGGDASALKAMRELLVSMAGASELFADALVLHESSGHSFFRHLMGSMSNKMAIEARRTDIRQSFDSLLQLSQAIAARDAADAGNDLQRLSVEIAQSSHRVTRNTYVVAVVAILVALAQVYLAIEGGRTEARYTTTVIERTK